jgi:methionyl-tRNA formyltransferase
LDILLITVNEYYYIPTFLGEIVDAEEYRIVGLTTMPPSLGTKNTAAFAYDLFRRFGPRVFSQHLAFYLKYRALDLFGRITGRGPPYSPKTLAKRHGIEHRHTTDINADQYLEYAADLQPDVIASVAATQKFSAELLAVPDQCAINVHSSLLPEYRGVSPSFWALFHDEEQTGITVHYMDEEIDTGDMIRQEALSIRDDDTLHSLNERVAERGSKMLQLALEDIRTESVDAGPIDPEAGDYYSLPSRDDVRRFLREGNEFY